MRKILIVSACLSIMLANSACLKTRAQLKEEGSDEASKPVPAKMQDVQPQGQYVIDEIKGELTRLSGRIEDLERQQKQASSDTSKEDIKKLEGRISELEQAQATMIEAMKKMETSTHATVDPVELFEKGRKQFEAEEYDASVETLSSYLKSPKAKSAVERATFMRAEAHYKLKQYKKAIVDYSKFPEKFTKSKYVSTALYKIGLSFEALGMKEDAKSFYQELMDKFPKSAEAKRVKPKLR